MGKLCQIIAVEKGSKNKAQSALTDVYQRMQKGQLLTGLSRTYRPKDDEGDRLPGESTRVQLTVDEVIRTATESLTDLFDVTATKDFGNCEAKASIVVDGNVLVADAPVTYLLFLEKKLVDVHTLITKLPTLDPSERWHFDEASACYASDPAETTRTKKVMRNHIRSVATEKHPAQVDTYTEDEVVGFWTTVKFSGAIPATRQRELLSRVEKLQRAVKFAREEANSREVKQVRVADAVFGYLFR